jgi:hypothetical protein
MLLQILEVINLACSLALTCNLYHGDSIDLACHAASRTGSRKASVSRLSIPPFRSGLLSGLAFILSDIAMEPRERGLRSCSAGKQEQAYGKVSK